MTRSEHARSCAFTSGGRAGCEPVSQAVASGARQARLSNELDLDRIREERVTPLVQGPNEIRLCVDCSTFALVLRKDDLRPISPQHQDVPPFRAEESAKAQQLVIGSMGRMIARGSYRRRTVEPARARNHQNALLL
jgi:hypothetical protein